MKRPLNKLPVPTEFDECVAFAQYLDLQVARGLVQMFSHIPEMHTMSHSQRMKNTMQGFRAGMLDYLILTKKSIVFIEMKRTRMSKVYPEQLAWTKALTGLGYTAVIVKGFDEAKAVIEANI